MKEFIQICYESFFRAAQNQNLVEKDYPIVFPNQKSHLLEDFQS